MKRTLTPLLVVCLALVSAEWLGGGTTQRTLDLPLAQWLSQGEHRDFKAKMEVNGPWLTFQQRMLVRVKTTVDLKALQKTGIRRDLHSVVKAADSSGNWLADESYIHNPAIEEAFKKDTDLEITTEMHLLPGDYTLASIVYDQVQNQHTVLMKRVHVPAVGKDPLPGLSRSLPVVEFLPPPETNLPRFGLGEVWLPVNNHRPVTVDLVFDVGAPIKSPRVGLGRYSAGQQVSVANLLSQMKLASGCLRLTGVDVLRQEVLFRKTNAEHFDWAKTRDEILKRNLDTIPVQTLAHEKATGAFFHDVMEDVVQSPNCDAKAAKPSADTRHFIIFVTSGVLFSPQTPRPQLREGPECGCRVFYIRVGRLNLFDDLIHILKPLAPRTVTAEDPRKFRKQVRELITEIEQYGS